MSRYGYMLPEHHDAEEEAKAEDRASGIVHCKLCKQGPFTWVRTGVRWRLVGERGKLHECAGAAGSADDFD